VAAPLKTHPTLGQVFRRYRAILKALGLPHSTAHRFEQDARIPDAFFERHLRTVRAQPAAELTTAGLRRAWQAQKPRVPTNVLTPDGSRDARDLKQATTTWLESFSVASRVDPTFVTQMEALRTHFRTTSLTDTVRALVRFAYAAITDAPAR